MAVLTPWRILGSLQVNDALLSMNDAKLVSLTLWKILSTPVTVAEEKYTWLEGKFIDCVVKARHCLQLPTRDWPLYEKEP